jgi:hypothetical protein
MNSHQNAVQGAQGPTVTIDPAQLPPRVTGTVKMSATRYRVVSRGTRVNAIISLTLVRSWTLDAFNQSRRATG